MSRHLGFEVIVTRQFTIDKTSVCKNAVDGSKQKMSLSDESGVLLSSETEAEILPVPVKRVRITEGRDDDAHDPRVGKEFQIEVSSFRDPRPNTPPAGVAASCGELQWQPACDKDTSMILMCY